MRLFRRRLACSFCGKRDSEVAKLVAGPQVFICDACVATAQRLMDDSGDATPPQVIRGGVLQRMLTRMRAAVHRVSGFRMAGAAPARAPRYFES
jgi:hypothetical protein